MREKLTPKQLDEEAKSFVTLCFFMLSEKSFKEISEKTKLAPGTVRYLFNGRVSRRTQYGTIAKLSAACGLKLEQTEYKSRVTLIKEVK